MPKCSLCERVFDESELAAGVCNSCRDEHGLPAAVLGTPLRPRIPCERCGGGSFVRGIVLRERTAEGLLRGPHGVSADNLSPVVTPLAITYDVSTEVTFFEERNVVRPNRLRPLGILESYTCRNCGLVELYARDAADIPIGAAHGTELFEVPGGSPYR